VWSILVPTSLPTVILSTAYLFQYSYVPIFCLKNYKSKSISPRTSTLTFPPIPQTAPTPLMLTLTRHMQTPIHLLHDSRTPRASLPPLPSRQPKQFIAFLIFRAHAGVLVPPAQRTCPPPTFRTGADGAMDVRWGDEGAAFSAIFWLAGCRLED
jgi:hypothetical protein